MFNANSFVNTSYSDFKSKPIKVIVQPCRRQATVLPRSINFRNPYVIDCLNDDQKVELPLTVCRLNVQSLGNTAIPVADYVISQGIDVLPLSLMLKLIGFEVYWISTG